MVWRRPRNEIKQSVWEFMMSRRLPCKFMEKKKKTLLHCPHPQSRRTLKGLAIIQRSCKMLCSKKIKPHAKAQYTNRGKVQLVWWKGRALVGLLTTGNGHARACTIASKGPSHQTRSICARKSTAPEPTAGFCCYKNKSFWKDVTEAQWWPCLWLFNWYSDKADISDKF
jgi:hypothetical protein